MKPHEKLRELLPRYNEILGNFIELGVSVANLEMSTQITDIRIATKLWSEVRSSLDAFILGEIGGHVRKQVVTKQVRSGNFATGRPITPELRKKMKDGYARWQKEQKEKLLKKNEKPLVYTGQKPQAEVVLPVTIGEVDGAGEQ